MAVERFAICPSSAERMLALMACRAMESAANWLLICSKSAIPGPIGTSNKVISATVSIGAEPLADTFFGSQGLDADWWRCDETKAWKLALDTHPNKAINCNRA